MAALTVTLACTPYDRVRALLDGSVGIEGCTVVPDAMRSEDLFPRVVDRADFDISEMSLSSYLVEVSRGVGAYVAIPVFPSRAFRHSGIYVRTDRGIATPADLRGRTVGIPEYQMTHGLWVRGMLADEYGVDTSAIRYRTAGTNEAGRKERLPLQVPPELDVRPLPAGATLNEALLAGELDAVISPSPPRAYVAGDPRVGRLFEDYGTAERAYYAKTRFFPIMHVVGIRRELVAADPGLAGRVAAAFATARDRALADLAEKARAGAPPFALPWFTESLEATVRLMGTDYWPYGIERNAAELAAICRYSREQHLSARELTLADLFPCEEFAHRSPGAPAIA
jgi:4,5-dihydroxyphthalate decarboxylase